MSIESTFTTNGPFVLGHTTTGHGFVTVYARYAAGTGTVTFGYFKQDSEDAALDFVAVTTPAAITGDASFSWEVGGNIYYGMSITGASGLDLRVLVSGDY